MYRRSNRGKHKKAVRKGVCFPHLKVQRFQRCSLPPKKGAVKELTLRAAPLQKIEMPLVKRPARKVIKLSEAMAILQISRTAVREMIARKELTPAPVPRRGVTSPIRLFQRDVEAIAREWGLL